MMSNKWEADIPYRLRHATITEPPSEGYPTNLGKVAADLIKELQRENEALRSQLSDWEMSPRTAQEAMESQANRIDELERTQIRLICAEQLRCARPEPLE